MPLICFASPKGGVGKTFMTANVAGLLARAGHSVIALDLDPQNALRLHFGMPLHETDGYTRELAHGSDWRARLRPTGSGVGLLAHGQTEAAGAVSLAVALSREPQMLAAPLRDMLAQPGAIVVADTMPGPSAQLAAVLPLVDLLVTVVQANASSVALLPSIESGAAYGTTSAVRAANVQAGAVPAGRLVFVVNQFDPRTRLGPGIVALMAEHVGPRLLGTVYSDESVSEAFASQKLLAEYAPGSKAAADLAGLTQRIALRLPAAAAAGSHAR